MTPQKMFTEAMWSGDAKGISKSIADGADPRAENSLALAVTAANGHTECVKLLIPLSDAMSEGSWALRMAAGNGHIDCVRLLIPVSDLDEARKLIKDDAILLIESIIQEEALMAKNTNQTEEKAECGL